jgi:ABC-type branched-subunit amino acid transport system ATPase component/MFS family permease
VTTGDDGVTTGDTMGEPRASLADVAGRVVAEAPPDQTVDPPPTAALPGVGDARLSVRAGLAMGGGSFTFIVLLLLNSLDELEAAAMGVLGPDIGSTLHVADGVIVFMTSASAAFVVLGVVPIGWLADRVKRAPIVGWCGLLFAAAGLASGLAVNAFQLFFARLFAGVAKANTLTVPVSILADTYPIGIRGRLAAILGTVGRTVGALSPILAGAIALAFGGVDGAGWRWAFILLGLPVAAVAFLAFRMPEPPRGQWETASVLGRDVAPADEEAALVSIDMAFARLGQIRSVRAMVLALSAIGFQLFAMVSLTNFFLRDTYGLDAFHRGLVTSLAGFATVLVVPFAGSRFDMLYRDDPARTMRLVALLILPGALLTPFQYNAPGPVLFTVLAVPGGVLGAAAWTMVGPMLQGVVPYKLRSLGIAYAALYVFLFGAVGGSLLGALLAGSLGEKWAIVLLAIPSSVVGSWLMWRGADSIRGDLATIAAEIHDEVAEQARRRDDAAQPMLQLVDVDHSYGHVQVLFGVELSVARGEVLALLGTNGAGKSTVLRVIAGLESPSRGVVRLDGRNITFASAEQRGALGIQMLPGGEGVFRSLSVERNLEVGAQSLPRDVRAERLDEAWATFPALAEARRRPAGSLSGGQQQQLALARILLHRPELLIIDELSLGLAPRVVGELLAVVERLKAAGQTMIIVEQSLNLAAAIADRAVFLEKGTVRFVGSPRELRERGDLARAVFFGTA